MGDKKFIHWHQGETIQQQLLKRAPAFIQRLIQTATSSHPAAISFPPGAITPQRMMRIVSACQGENGRPF
jgi:hypothetical protein